MTKQEPQATGGNLNDDDEDVKKMCHNAATML